MQASAFDIGNALHDARLALGLTLGRAAAGICSRGELSRLESGAPDAERALLERLIGAMELDDRLVPRDPNAARRTACETAIRKGLWEDMDSAVALLPQDCNEHAFYLALSIEASGGVADAAGKLAQWITSTPQGLYRLRAQTALCRCLRDNSQLAAAIELGESALAEALSDPEGDVEAGAELRGTLAGAYCETGHIERALELTEPPPATLEPSPWSEATRCWARAMTLYAAGRMDDARDVAFMGLEIMSRLDRPIALARLKNVGVWLAMQSNNFDAEQLHRLIEDSAGGTLDKDGPLSVSAVKTTEAQLLAKLGDRSRARRLLGDAQRIMLSEDEGSRARILAACGEVYAAMGDIEDAVRLLLMARQLLEDSGARRSAAATWRQMADIYTKLGEADLALACMRAAMELLDL